MPQIFTLMHLFLKTACLISIANACHSQIVIDIKDNTGENHENHYYKDTANFLDNFTGKYIFESESTSIEIVLEKRERSSMNDVYFEDLIIGEFRILENGKEIRSTLDKLKTRYNNSAKHSLHGNLILTGKRRGYNDCLPDEIQLVLGFVDEHQSGIAQFILRKVMRNNTMGLEVNVIWHNLINVDNKTNTKVPTIQNGKYFFRKL